jgi:cold shock CspA family protein
MVQISYPSFGPSEAGLFRRRYEGQRVSFGSGQCQNRPSAVNAKAL